MPIQIIENHYNAPIGKIINEELKKAKVVKIAVAFLKYSGIEEIKDALSQCLKNGGGIELIIGLDFIITDPKAIRYFLGLKKKNPNVNLYYFKRNVSFHPKIYLFENDKGKTGIVGSTNLTRGGLISNYEVNVVSKNPDDFSKLLAIYDSFKGECFLFDKEILKKYSEIHRKFSEYKKNAMKDKRIQEILKEIQNKERSLLRPRTLVSIIVEAIKRKEREQGQRYVRLAKIYEEVKKIVTENNLGYKMDALKDNIRGELNYNEQNAKDYGRRNLNLFIRSTERAYYTLTENGKNYRR